MLSKAKKVIRYFGFKNQIRKLSEENFELIEALLEYSNYILFDEHKKELREKIIDELADNWFLLLQFVQYLGVKDGDLWDKLEFKSDRTLRRMGEGYYD